MEPLTREFVFAQAARKLRQDFEETRVVPHSGARGAEGESILRSFLNDHLPKRFQAGAGFIIDRRDQVSRQTDVVVYDAYNCPVYRASDTAGIFPNDNVAAVVEVKSRLDKEKLFAAADNIAAAKSLAKTKEPNTPGFVQTFTLGCLFAFGSDLSTETLLSHYVETIKAHDLGLHIDIIAVLDRAFYTMVTRPRGHENWGIATIEGLGGSAAEGSHLGVCSHEAGEEALDGFFRYLLFHLTFFRAIVPHPGFNFRNPGGQVMYLMTITHEKNPKKRAAKMKQYAEEIRREFGSSNKQE